LGIAVHPDYEYAAIENGDEVLIVASELVGYVVVNCCIGELNEAGVRPMPKILAKFPGSKMENLLCRHPWIDRTSLLMCGDHVTLGRRIGRRNRTRRQRGAQQKRDEQSRNRLRSHRARTRTRRLRYRQKIRLGGLLSGR
jgi:hypothetical protein